MNSQSEGKILYQLRVDFFINYKLDFSAYPFKKMLSLQSVSYNISSKIFLLIDSKNIVCQSSFPFTIGMWANMGNVRNFGHPSLFMVFSELKNKTL